MRQLGLQGPGPRVVYFHCCLLKKPVFARFLVVNSGLFCFLLCLNRLGHKYLVCALYYFHQLVYSYHLDQNLLEQRKLQFMVHVQFTIANITYTA